MDNTIEFGRGDGADPTFSIPAANWTPNGKLFFAAKQQFDDDPQDLLAKIKGEWDDSDVSDVTINGIAYKRYACHFPASATYGIASNGAATLELLGEFQFVPQTGDPITFPAKNADKIRVIVYFDIIREIA